MSDEAIYSSTDHMTIPITFRTNVVQPLVCLKEGFDLIKDQYWLFLGVTFVGLIMGSVAPFAILMGPAWCGIYLCLLTKLKGERPAFEMLFKGFDYFVESLIATLVQIAVMFVIMLPIILIVILVVLFGSMFGPMVFHGGSLSSPAGTGFILILLLCILVCAVVILIPSVLFIFCYPLIVEKNLKGLEAVKLSAKAAWANFGSLLLLFLLTSLLSVIGVFFCYIGAIFVLPISFAAWFMAYKKVFMVSEKGEQPVMY